MGEGQSSHEVAPLKEKWVRLKPFARLHQSPFPIVALTGGIASGKSSVAKFFKEKGVPVVSADDLIKDIYRWPLTKLWLQALAPDVFDDGEILFAKLREKVFQDEALKTEIETFLYARLPQAFKDRLKDFARIPWLIYEIPLLYERQMQELFDATIVSWVPRDIQRHRLMARDPLTTPATAEAILAAQLPLDQKRKLSDLVFENVHVPGPAMTAALEKLWLQLVA